MADFEPAFLKTLANEGGEEFTDHKEDNGGATKFGISQKSYPNIDIKNLTEDEAAKIYRRDYWNVLKCGSIHSQKKAEVVFDTAVNMGPKTCTILVQKSIGLKCDGIFGRETLRNLNFADEKSFLQQFASLKMEHYSAICSKDPRQTKFLLGWMRRTLRGLI